VRRQLVTTATRQTVVYGLNHICLATMLRPMYDQGSVHVANDLRKIVQLVSATVGSLTIKTSRGMSTEHVQNTCCSHRRSQVVSDGRTTVVRPLAAGLALIVDDRGISIRKTGHVTCL